MRNSLSVNGTHLANVHSFKYLGSTVTDDCRMDKEIDCIIQCATTSFGRLWDRLWSSHDISNKTNISVYNAAITSALLFGAETWTLYLRHLSTAKCPTTISTSHPPCPIYWQYYQWSNPWQSWRARYWDDSSVDTPPVGWSCGTHVRWPNLETFVVWRAHNRYNYCRPPTSALEGLTQRHFKPIKHLHNALARHRNWS